MKKNLLFILIPLLSFGQVKIGQDIDGEAAGDGSGRIALSADGEIIAIGASSNDGNGENSGHVRIYRNESGNWLQIGEDIDGEAAGDLAGPVALSSDGSIVAIGASRNNGNGEWSGHVRVFKNINDTWKQIGQDINGEAAEDRSGSAIALSSNGNIVAIGATDNGGDLSGHVRVFQNINETWTQIGQSIKGEGLFDHFGYAVSLSADGHRLAASSQRNSNSRGRVKVFEYQTGYWYQIGQNLEGEAEPDQFGTSISMSEDGNTIAIGAPLNDDYAARSGHVRIYEYQTWQWVQIGQDINGEAAYDGSGQSVSLSSDGKTVAIGSWRNDDNGVDAGQVRIYKNDNGNWVKKGLDIEGEAAGDWFGVYLALSSDASIVAISASRNDGVNGEGSGHVRVYDLTAVLSTESFKQNYFSFYPNPVKNVLNIQLNNGLVLKQVNIYNIQSQYLYSVKTKTIDSENLKSGVYFVEVETNKGKSAQKIVVE
ncbi:T9SS type A sorting domain-containing protein [Flavobacteriaceae bacterium GSB9]|nr:T9SS type A sorting domain-containing protein [Flavobacteriaceae bacterium GSB9]